MEAKILEEGLSLMKFLNTALETMDNRMLNRVEELGRMRPGGAVDLDALGDKVWMEQFR